MLDKKECWTNEGQMGSPVLPNNFILNEKIQTLRIYI